MITTPLSPKYQIVIPKSVHQKLALKPGQKLSVTEIDGHIELTPVLTPEEVVGFLKSNKPLVFERESDRKL